MVKKTGIFGLFTLATLAIFSLPARAQPAIQQSYPEVMINGNNNHVKINITKTYVDQSTTGAVSSSNPVNSQGSPYGDRAAVQQPSQPVINDGNYVQVRGVLVRRRGP